MSHEGMCFNHHSGISEGSMNDLHQTVGKKTLLTVSERQELLYKHNQKAHESIICNLQKKTLI